MDRKCLIIAGGESVNKPLLKQQADKSEFIICADSGYNHAKNLNIVPNIVVGDFDSYSQTINDIDIIKLPVEKDDTDLHYAAKYSLSKGYKSVAIFGGYGSRPDQNFAMLSTLKFLVDNGCSAVCYGKGFSISVIVNSTIAIPSNNEILSVFPFGGCAYGVTITGCKYNLTNYDMKPEFPIGVSNCIVDDLCSVRVSDGCLVIMQVDEKML